MQPPASIQRSASGPLDHHSPLDGLNAFTSGPCLPKANVLATKPTRHITIMLKWNVRLNHGGKENIKKIPGSSDGHLT